jgi:hypothetical protein
MIISPPRIAETLSTPPIEAVTDAITVTFAPKLSNNDIASISSTIRTDAWGTGNKQRRLGLPPTLLSSIRDRDLLEGDRKRAVSAAPCGCGESCRTASTEESGNPPRLPISASRRLKSAPACSSGRVLHQNVALRCWNISKVFLQFTSNFLQISGTIGFLAIGCSFDSWVTTTPPSSLACATTQGSPPF